MFRKRLVLSLLLLLILLGCKTVKQADTAADEPAPDFLNQNPAKTNEITDGYVKLILNEKTGSFSLSSLSDSSYKPLFSSRNQKSSYISISVDGKIYRLGQSGAFKSKAENEYGEPAFVFESKSIKVTQVFSKVKTSGSQNTNGVLVKITVENTGAQSSKVGLRFLLDTDLGEKQKIPFITDKFEITKELKIEKEEGEKFWISRGESISLMGSIVNPLDDSAETPDFIHFANWKRLNDAPWKLRYAEERSFTFLPHSIKDSAVCYYYEPSVIDAGGSFTCKIFLTTEDIEWYNLQKTAETASRAPLERSNPVTDTFISPRSETIASLQREALNEASWTNKDAETLTMEKIHNLLARFIAGDIILYEADMAEIERIIILHNRK